MMTVLFIEVAVFGLISVLILLSVVWHISQLLTAVQEIRERLERMERSSTVEQESVHPSNGAPYPIPPRVANAKLRN